MLKAESILKCMSIEQKCAQMVFPAFSFDAPDYDGIMKMARLGAGGVCTYQGRVKKYIEFINNLQKEAKIPMIVACDFESGSGDQITDGNLFPTSMAVAATGDTRFSYLKGKITSLEASALGVNWVFAPVVDCNTNPLNPVINTRAFSDDPQTVIKFAKKYMKGLATYGTLNSIKHFPGHGDPDVDSHLELPRLKISLGEMEKRELLPFKQLLPMADSVMVGHLRVDAIDRKRAASLSFKVTTGLLRRKLGFKNAIVTDALMMGGVTSHLSDEQAIESAVNAGADILLFPCDPEQAVQKVRSMVSSGELAETELDERVKRILRMKVCCGLFRSRKPSYERAVDVLKRGSTRKVMRDIAEKSITLVKNVGQVLPLKTNAVHYLKIHDESAGDTPDLFESEIQKYCDLREDADVVLLAVFFKPRPFAGKTKIDRKRIGRVVSCIGKRKAVVVALGSPYVVRQFMGLEGWVCAFSGASESQEAAAKAIFGKIPFKGISPVRI